MSRDGFRDHLVAYDVGMAIPVAEVGVAPAGDGASEILQDRHRLEPLLRNARLDEAPEIPLGAQEGAIGGGRLDAGGRHLALADAVTVHHGHMPEIEILDADRATGIWAMFDQVDLPGLVLRGFGHYHDEYVRSGARWRIHRSRLTRLRLDIERKPAS